MQRLTSSDSNPLLTSLPSQAWSLDRQMLQAQFQQAGDFGVLDFHF